RSGGHRVRSSLFVWRRISRSVWIRLTMAARILRQTHWCSVDLDAMLVHQIVVGSVSARKPDHAPTDHVAIPAIHRISEEAFEGASPQMGKEHLRRNSIQIFAARFELAQIAILLVRVHLGERSARGSELLVDCADGFLEKFRRRERQLVTLTWRTGLPWAATVETFARSPCAAQLFIYIIRYTGFDRAAPLFIRRN